MFFIAYFVVIFLHKDAQRDYEVPGGMIGKIFFGGSGLVLSVLALYAAFSIPSSIGAGVSYALDKDLDLDLGYRYVDLGKVNASTVAPWTFTGTNISGVTVSDYEAKLKSHDFSIGLRYKF